jgi:hypothetical protein
MRLLLAIFLLYFCTACEKVIDVDLNDADKKMVIEGVITNRPGTCMVLLSYTKNFDDNNSFAGVSGATIQIAEEGGPTTLLAETAAGVYEAPALTGTIGKSYHLIVALNGTQFTATSIMPQPVNMDTIFVTDETVFGNTRKLVNVQFKDPSHTGNNYRFIQFVNGLKEQEIFIRNDELFNGNTIATKLRYPSDDDNKIKSSDLIKIDMLCIDSAIYKYWYSLDRSATGGSGNMAATPANPVTNIRGGALGYFSAHTFQSKSMRVP